MKSNSTKPINPAYAPKSCWEVYTKPKQLQEIQALATRYLAFLSQCKTERETIDYVMRTLQAAGYAEGARQKMLYPLRGKALFVARKGKLPLSAGWHLISAHTDTPRLDCKQRPFIEQPGVAQAKTHYYGGIRKYQWLARPLALHGVAVRSNGDVVRITLGEDPHEPVFTIADLLPHLAHKQISQSISDAFEAEKLNIILGHSPLASDTKQNTAKDKKTDKTDVDKDRIKARVLSILQQKYGLIEEDFISAELQAVPAGPARFVGLDSALMGGYGHDDRLCVFAALEAMCSSKNPPHCTAVMLWDKEEIGSEGATGASSRFMEYCMEECRQQWSPTARFGEMMLATRAISADVHAPIDPDWQEVHEKQNAAQLGYGACFSKFTGSRGKYGASEADAELVGWMRGLLNAKKIPWQMAELGKVDIGGGGTVALFLAAYGMSVIDLGPPVLSMHSPFELASTADLKATVDAYRAFLEA